MVETGLSDIVMPTGISSLDPVLEGGIPGGSLVLLLHDVGGGAREFAYSSLLYLSLMKVQGVAMKERLPEQIVYVTVTRSKEDITQEISLSFHRDLSMNFSSVNFEDLSPLYFEMSAAPIAWYGSGDILSRMRAREGHDSLLPFLTNRLSSYPKMSLVVIDSLTTVATQIAASGDWKDLVAFLRGLQRVAKAWNSTFYLLLTGGILAPQLEVEIADTVDAVLLFRWEDISGSRRHRVMSIQKFRGLMPHLEEKDLVKFAIRISAGGGFEVSNIRVVI
ncbi:MAG: hypothetical protein NT074_08130 [Methanomicrobiales archaeon]|nr:hypothetical protein [Methanomicrobiales archaeon]